MTPRLTDVMHDRADQLGAPLVDLDAVVAAGKGRVRRRRAVTGAAVATGTAAVLVGAFALSGLGPGTPSPTIQQPFAAAFAESTPAYALGKDVHIDGRQFSVPTEVHAFVQTTHGVVYSDRAGAVWSADGDTDARKIGTTDPDEPRLAADASSAAWAQGGEEGSAFVVVDQSDGEVAAVPATGNLQRVGVYALDGTTVYGRDTRGVVKADLATGTTTVLMPWSGDVELVDVEDGLIAYRAPTTPESRDMVSRVTRTVGEGGEIEAWNMLDLSDDGARILGETDPDEFAVFDVASGTHETIRVPGYEFIVGYRWLDADTYLMIGMNPPYENAKVDLLECEVGGACAVVLDQVGSFDDDLVLSFGEPMDG